MARLKPGLPKTIYVQPRPPGWPVQAPLERDFPRAWPHPYGGEDASLLPATRRLLRFDFWRARLPRRVGSPSGAKTRGSF